MRCWVVLLAWVAAGCSSSQTWPWAARDCGLGWSWEGELVCEGDLAQLAAEFRASALQPVQIRPGTIYARVGSRLVARGVMRTPWLRAFAIPVWIHEDPGSRLRALPGLGRTRTRALLELRAPGSCVDPTAVRGIGPKTIARWGSRAVEAPDQAPCLWWNGVAMVLQPCALTPLD